jgi:ADP-heptose:LPS heptosyltransferase
MTRPIRFSASERVLLIASTGVGNVLQFTPALRTLKGNHPDASIDSLCFSNATACVMRNNPHVHETIVHTGSSYVYPRRDQRIRGEQENRQDQAIIKALSARRYTTSINIFPINGLRPAIFVRRIGARKRIGIPLANPRFRWMTRFFYTDVVDVRPDQHGVDIGFAHVGIDSAGQCRQMEITIPESTLAAAKDTLLRFRWKPEERIVGIHPGCLARNKEKRWPADRFAAVARWLVKERGNRVLIFIGPDERDLLEPLRDRLADLGDSCHIDTEAGLEEVAALMTSCDAFFSNDSGLMHLASAVGTPVLGIFGPTDPRRYAPSGPRDRFLFHPLACSNCYDSKTMAACRSATCMEMITVEQVQNELDSMLRGES